ncbi:uncharacterized protein BDZ99DRAFT_577146 [Mytilinidion resinicola]|uniref:Uncharacterized protein n=1 Tax=Mytilinidion resinicola TaxID=574789 RepID=A0A6A6XZF7_9PEZI|nr:uncharacterized protein BDZ99DRAFT_577146 [Mytilinidion resinicola]KAF2801902.1 hypothetical protein BDZ99DRAFT_577146 [Mytilinidion resinicola]
MVLCCHGFLKLGANRFDNLRPDYDHPKSRVFSQLAAANIIFSQTLEVRRHCRIRPLSDLPSWAPDWSVSDSAALLPAHNYNHTWNDAEYKSKEEESDDDSQEEEPKHEGQECTIDIENKATNALTDPKFVTEPAEQVKSHMELNGYPRRTNIRTCDLWADIPSLSISGDMRTLTAHGFIWDSMKILSDPFPSDVSKQWQNATHFMINVGQCKAILDSLSDHPNPYQTARRRLESLWRTLRADHSGEDDYPIPDYLFQPDEEERRVGFQDWLPPIPKNWIPRTPHVSSIWTDPSTARPCTPTSNWTRSPKRNTLM